MRRSWPAILWGVTLLILSAIPGKYFPTLEWYALFTPDKLVHMGMYGFWTWLIWRIPSRNKLRSLVMPMFITTTFGYLMELGQAHLFEGRAYELADQLANMIGIAASSGLISLFAQRESSGDS